MTERTLDGRVAVVTGASRGLGEAIAKALAGAGAKVALVARDEARLEAVAGAIRTAGGEAAVLPADVADEAAVGALPARVEAALGPCDILVNNAGAMSRKRLEDFSLEEWHRMVEVNLTGPFLLCRAFVPGMKARGGGRIVNLTSTMSHISYPERSAYSATKAGLLGFTRALALELAPDGITVVGISPGPFKTDMMAGVDENPEAKRAFLARVPLGRFGEPADIGALAVFLCSDAAGFITGTDVLIDGGWTAI